MHFNHRRTKSNQEVNKSQRSPSDFSTASHPGRVRACVRSRLVGLLFSGSGNVAVHTLIFRKKKKNRTRPIRERRGRCREIRNPIQAARAPLHCKCGRGHSQFQKEQVSYIRVWRDGGPSCSPSCEAHARAGPPVINTDLLEIPAEPRHCRRGGGGVEWVGSKLRSGPFNKQRCLHVTRLL